jgi:hypothetical protein
MPLYPRDFIKTTLLGEYRQIIYKHKYYYIGFALVCVGIEFIGKCIDAEQDWHKIGQSKRHFAEALAETMPAYKTHGDLLYKELRSGFAHGLLPGPQIGLTHRAESKEYGTTHLSKHHGTITVVIEDLYDDFAGACENVLQRHFPARDKMSKPLLAIPSDSAVRAVNLGGAFNARTTPY